MSATSRESAAAERRQIVAHGASYGSGANARKAPEGRQNLSPVWGFALPRRLLPQLTLWAMICCPSAALLTGCGGPSSANIELRKENQNLHDQIDSLTKAQEGDRATIEALQNKVGTVPTLPQQRLEKLFTTHGLKLGRLTGGADLDPSKAGDEGIKVYVTPTDETGEPIKAAGSFVVEAFDLAAKPPEVARCAYDLNAARQSWNGALMSYNYVLTCPWQTPPRHDEITIKVTFRDELTGREFHAQQVVKVHLPPVSATSTQARQ